MRLSRLYQYLRALVVFGCFASILCFIFYFFVGFSSQRISSDGRVIAETTYYVEWAVFSVLTIMLFLPTSLYLSGGSSSETGYTLRSIIAKVALVNFGIGILAFMIFSERQGVSFLETKFFLILAVVLNLPLVIWAGMRLSKLHHKYSNMIMITLVGLMLAGLIVFCVARPDITLTHKICAGIFSTPLITLFVLRHTKTAFILYAASLCISIVLWQVPMSSRPRFLENLYRIQVGMTVVEVDEIMQGYMKGVSENLAFLTGKRDKLQEVTNEQGEVEYEGRIFFRHSDDTAFNSDWGIVTFEKSLVVDVVFYPD